MSAFNYKVIIKVLGAITTIIGLTMIPPLFVAMIYHENLLVISYLKTIIPSVLTGLIIIFCVKPGSTSLKIRDGYLIAGLCWVVASAIGAFPYLLSGVMTNFIDAFFESVSGFTTTGSTIIVDLSEIPKSLQFWRSFCHWLGGMGILILAISLLPALGIGGLKIVSAEAPGPTIEKMSAKITDSAKILYIMYISFTLIEILLLCLGGLNLFDAMIHTFGSMGTGGLSNYSNGVAHFDSIYVEFIIIVFSVFASINFVLYHHILQGRWRDFWRDPELRTFLIILGVSILLIALNLRLTNTYPNIGNSLRYSFFQATSFITTSGFATTDYTLWPSFTQIVLFCLMFIGGCSASTCGSIKVIRIMILFKLFIRGLYKRLHPNAVVPVKLGGKIISSETVSRVSSFTILFFTLFVISSLVVSLENYDLITTISAAASSLSNTGMGLGLVGPAGTFSIFSEPTRLYLSFIMIAGRLELFTIIMMLTPSFWKSS
ncbi:TrkH family potassium uptake protein [Sinanaerobacter chloroacetimidivorans]|jgi:trk system potassium uptake protein TrkH|uniref:TrkH family potassium uptake protein n=1 Tax=Sinanaerobacter chloroacetimidivorans TaxID=2818044 RepID=A0A8J7W7D3_9FIRM|nr:potassium transporter TrkG [Sinanaerobacter chloroacetimidivorans]MBR0600245.1 TrkH family potassium uptake protein [Sinanaerobacter chloroacetimidivorans]